MSTTSVKYLTSHKPFGANELNANINIAVTKEGHAYEIWLPDTTVDGPGCGHIHAPSCVIKFQDGPVKEAGLNGVSNEALLAVLIDRYEHFQAGPFKCRENAIVLTKLEEAVLWNGKRTLDRMARGVEGTHKS